MVRKDPSDSVPKTEYPGSGNFVRQSAGNMLLEKNREIDIEVKAALEKRKQEGSEVVLPGSGVYYINSLNVLIANQIRSAGFDPELTSIAPPTLKADTTSNVDIAFNVAGMARATGQSPIEVAQSLAANLSQLDMVQSVETVGPFVNIQLEPRSVAHSVIGQIEIMGEEYGHFRDEDPQLVLIDYSSPNVAKNMTVAHLRSTIIGQSLMKIQKAAGNVPFGVNHIGDWGNQFGQYIYQYRKELAEKGDDFIAELEADPTATLMRIYRDFNEAADENPELKEITGEIFLQLEQGDPELLELWEKFRTWSLRDFGPIYDRLGVKFDAIQGESFYEDRMTPTIEEGLEQGVLKINEKGAVIFPAQELVNGKGQRNSRIMLSRTGEARPEELVKDTGGTMYLTRDLAAIRYRAEELGVDKILYVIGKEQQVHCIKLFNMADQIGYMSLGDAEHVSFGHLTLNGRKMKTRKGKVVLLTDVIDDTLVEAESSMKIHKQQRGDDSELTDAEKETARKIAMSTLVFNDLQQDRENDIAFNPDAVQGVEAGKATYILYTNTRLQGVIDKAGDVDELKEVPEGLSREEGELVVHLGRLPEVVKEAAELSAPHKLANYLTQLCKLANVFYNEKSVLEAGTEAERIFRIHLMKSTQQVIKNTSFLLHMELPERM